uniref:Capsid protein n=1 Tax=viral metagenome TaxID=1070528 RepID=A0A2V0RN80_9ZZZZ
MKYSRKTTRMAAFLPGAGGFASKIAGSAIRKTAAAYGQGADPRTAAEIGTTGAVFENLPPGMKPFLDVPGNQISNSGKPDPNNEPKEETSMKKGNGNGNRKTTTGTTPPPSGGGNNRNRRRRRGDDDYTPSTTGSSIKSYGAGYGITDSGSLVNEQYSKFGGAFYNPLYVQDVEEDRGPLNQNTVRTAIRVISCYPTNLLQTDLPTADPFRTTFLNSNSESISSIERIYAEVKMQVNSNVGGGTAASKNSLTFNKYLEFIRLGMSGLALLCQINAIQSWDPDYLESNLVIREMKDQAANSINLYAARNRLMNKLVYLSLPPKVINYYLELFQFYKKTPVEGGGHQFHILESLAIDLSSTTDTDFATIISEVNSICAEIDATPGLDDLATISALLVEKADYQFINLRRVQGMYNKPCFNPRMNGVLDNCPTSTESKKKLGETIVTNGGLAFTEDAICAYPMDPENVSIYEAAHTLPLWDQVQYNSETGAFSHNKTAFPFFQYVYELTGSVQHNNTGYLAVSTKLGDVLKPYGLGFTIISDPQTHITNHITSVSTLLLNGEVNSLAVPKGDNNYLYNFSHRNVLNANVRLIYDLFGVQIF